MRWSFKASVKRSLKRYTSDLGSPKFLVLLLVKYYLDGSFGRGIFRWTILDVKWSIDSLQCKVTVHVWCMRLLFFYSPGVRVLPDVICLYQYLQQNVEHNPFAWTS